MLFALLVLLRRMKPGFFATSYPGPRVVFLQSFRGLRGPLSNRLETMISLATYSLGPLTPEAKRQDSRRGIHLREEGKGRDGIEILR
jgi:hypothetical protein